MKAQTHSDRSFEFYFRDQDTQFLVEDAGDEVIIRATRNTFSDERKAAFLHELAAEGFIPDRYQWSSNSGAAWAPVRWLVDNSWMQIYPANTARTRRFMLRLLGAAAVIWLLTMSALIIHWV